MIRRLVDFSLNNRLLVLAIATLLFIWGVISFRSLPVEAYPRAWQHDRRLPRLLPVRPPGPGGHRPHRGGLPRDVRLAARVPCPRPEEHDPARLRRGRAGGPERARTQAHRVLVQPGPRPRKLLSNLSPSGIPTYPFLE